MSRVEHIAEGVTLYQGDCREILPTLGRFDAVVTDPPYGINIAATGSVGGRKLAKVTTFEKSQWDNKTADDAVELAIRISDWSIIFGGNYYKLEPTSCWLVWDKLNTGNFADCELAWTNLKKPVRRIQFRWNGMLRQNNEPRGDHPTQKPIEVMRWCIGQLPPEANTILDPFMGSGTTGVAAAKLGRHFTGIEREQNYFDIACRRISEAMKQPDLFVEQPKAVATQEALL